ncbi:MAG: hypothetical protein A4E61_01119 [Syntrophorhabdus sp. PtaB.Bin184]|nr:MAG: hypothetical protein A4E61_01119 [Syntrophorhabdus sp. PtaB.Bin184]
MQALLLGLSNGPVCFAYCAPVLIPYILGSQRGVRAAGASVGHFLLGRLLGYLLFGFASWLMGRTILHTVGFPGFLLGAFYVILSVSLLLFSFRTCTPACASSGNCAGLFGRIKPSGVFVPFWSGLSTSLSLCPPLLLTIAAGMAKTSAIENLLFFVLFFIGTSVFFIPLPFIGLTRAFAPLRTIGKMAAALMAVYYLYSGIILILGGLQIS